MKTTRPSSGPAQQADPKIVKKTRRDNAAYTSLGGLFGEQDQEYLPQPPGNSLPPRPLEFGRPGL